MASLLLSSWGSPTPSNNIMKIPKKKKPPGSSLPKGVYTYIKVIIIF
ncbi:unnamed protein product, partial [Vitis vinifera]|uniref:Uncharacterized protein n=1 Tax=Vitis vinifera TaxID=29760 RepID=D7TF71_VITVI